MTLIDHDHDGLSEYEREQEARWNSRTPEQHAAHEEAMWIGPDPDADWLMYHWSELSPAARRRHRHRLPRAVRARYT